VYYVQFFLLIPWTCIVFFFLFFFSLGELQDRDGNIVYDKDDKPRIHTDGTGFISEDLALLCPHNFYKGEQIRDENVEVCDTGLFPFKIHFDCLNVAV
jgi:hypothetical protein